ncbi:Putative carboxymethylenebutenolidase [Geodia barretti]|uniref:Carboxymethylenebutenolidase n=1 Tax=Geodia barretti TaxID=519541 RepID=A0AA35SUX7_GEOBA|nr:Putative carboxymethylenebutenolidase [Geodia barretti]
MDMYASVPSSSAGFSAPFPAVLVAQHATGVDAFIQDICDRLAAQGYAAVAPNLYHRVTDPALLNEQPRPRPAALLSDPDIIADVNAAVEWLRNHDAVQSDRIGVTGFCMGGRIAWLAAATNPHFAAVLAENINCPMLFHFGEIDVNPSPDDMRALDAELDRLGKGHQFHSYPGADHAFMNPAGGRYQQAAAEASWPRTVEFFDRHLKG